MTNLSQTTCVNCGAPLSDNFCSQCGEKRFSEHDKSVGHFLHEAFHFITHLDGKFLKSLRLVFTKPGLLSYDYCRGIRKRYFKPVSLFLIGVILYLIFPLLQGLNLSHREAINTFGSLGVHIPENMSQWKAEKKNITWEELGKAYDAKSPKVAKILLLILLPLTAGLLWILFFRKRAYFFDHLLLGVELNTLLLYSMFLILPLLLLLVSKLGEATHFFDFRYGDPLLLPLQIIVLGMGWGAAFRRFYATGRWETVWKTFVFFVLHSILLYFVYRFILFIVVMLLL